MRYPLLRVDPQQRGPMEEIQDNLTARVTEAELEAESLRVSLAAAQTNSPSSTNLPGMLDT